MNRQARRQARQHRQQKSRNAAHPPRNHSLEGRTKVEYQGFTHGLLLIFLYIKAFRHLSRLTRQPLRPEPEARHDAQTNNKQRTTTNNNTHTDRQTDRLADGQDGQDGTDGQLVRRLYRQSAKKHKFKILCRNSYAPTSET